MDTIYLSSSLLIEAEEVPQLILAGGAHLVDLVAQDQHGAVGQRLVRQQRIQLRLGLGQADAVARVHQEHDGVHGREIVPPHAPGLRVPAQVKRGEAHVANGQLLRCCRKKNYLTNCTERR